MEALIRTEQSADGVLLATIDMPGRSMNVFSAELMDALEALMNRVDSDSAVRSVVLTSGKSSFLAGADLVMVQGFCAAALTATTDELFQLCGRLGRLFVRLEASAKPWVAALNGLALGGGLELALACRERVVADDPKLQLGTPEVRWGLLPGAGGTQRLPRMAGFEKGMELLLTGRSITPAEALAHGVVDQVVAASEVVAQARSRAIALQGTPFDAARKFRGIAQADVPSAADADPINIAARHGVAAEDLGHYPAYRALIASVVLGARLPLAEATAVEMRQFLRLMVSPVAGRMIRTLFLERLRAERELAAPAGLRIEQVRLGAVSAERRGWADALARARLTQAHDEALPPDTMELVDATGQGRRFALRMLSDEPAAADQPTLVLSPAGPYGRIVEVVACDAAHAQAAAALAQMIWSLAWPSGESVPWLARLRGQPLETQAALAREWQIAHPQEDAVFLDVAACLAGVTPAWSGGPLLWATGTQPA